MPDFDLTDETQLLFAFVTDGCGGLYLLDCNQRVVVKRTLTTDTPYELRGAMQAMLSNVNT